jgi:N-methylhydantoinase B
MKIVSEGHLNKELAELIAFNVRLPEECMGDLTGMLAANKTMADRLLEMIDDEGIQDFSGVSDEIHRRSEEAMRGAIDEIPTGHYEGQVTFDSAGFPVQICVAVDVADRAVRVNFAGTSRQIRDTSINVVMNYTYAFTVYPLKLLVNPRLATNDGCLRPLEITAPTGSILNSTWPAGGFSRNYVGHMIHAALFSALEGVLPDRIWGHSGSAPTGPDCVMGIRKDGRPFVHLFFAGSGGTGAMPHKDGETCNFPTNARATSVELTEAAAPILFERRELIMDSAGAGTHRGGLASAWTIRNVGSDSITYTGQVGRINYPALGLLGGEDGRPNRLYYNGEPEERGWGRWELRPGESFRKEGAGGGGLGSPLLRDPAKVLEDVLEGSVSQDEARETYGVLIQSDRVVGATTQRQRLSGSTGIEGG